MGLAESSGNYNPVLKIEETASGIFLTIKGGVPGHVISNIISSGLIPIDLNTIGLFSLYIESYQELIVL